jgi:hypothetical protein
MADIFTKLNQFENALISAWTYDTKLDYREAYASSNQLKKIDEYHAKCRELKEQLIAEIKELMND